MREEQDSNWTTTQIRPFGIVVTAQPSGANPISVPTEQIKAWIDQHRITVLRGFAPPDGDALMEIGKRLGEVLEWSFGAVNELQVKPDARNYLYTTAAVPFHWDGAFIGRIPHYIVFHCAQAPGPADGGETLFTDTTMLLAAAPEQTKELWQSLEITYSTEKVVHYGGQFTSPMLATHPITGETILRYAEPVMDLNPVRLEIRGLVDAKPEHFIEDLHERLNDPAVCYAHTWQDGDIVIADNFALLHGRAAVKADAPRHLRRVNVL